MQKIPTMFERDETVRGHPVRGVIKAECQWVLDGEGFATQKLDGTNVKIEGGELYRRQKPTVGEYDEASYVPCQRDNPSDQWLWEAFDALVMRVDGIYEACGPKIQGNKESYQSHRMIAVVPPDPQLRLQVTTPRSFGGLMEFLEKLSIEGVVFHHYDGRMAKIKRRDFGLL